MNEANVSTGFVERKIGEQLLHETVDGYDDKRDVGTRNKVEGCEMMYDLKIHGVLYSRVRVEDG